MPDMVLIWKRRRSTSLSFVSIKQSNLIHELNSQWVCARLRHGARHGTSHQLPPSSWILLALLGQVLPDEFIHHKVQADIRRNAGHGRDDAPVQRRNASFCPVHDPHGLPHAGQLLGSLAEFRKRRRLDREARAHDIERVGEDDGRDAGDAAARQAREGRQAVARVPLKEVLQPKHRQHKSPSFHPTREKWEGKLTLL